MFDWVCRSKLTLEFSDVLPVGTVAAEGSNRLVSIDLKHQLVFTSSQRFEQCYEIGFDRNFPTWAFERCFAASLSNHWAPLARCSADFPVEACRRECLCLIPARLCEFLTGCTLWDWQVIWEGDNSVAQNCCSSRQMLSLVMSLETGGSARSSSRKVETAVDWACFELELNVPGDSRRDLPSHHCHTTGFVAKSYE